MPITRGSICVIKRVRTRAKELMRRSLSGAIRVRRTLNKAGDRNADKLARINIKLIAQGTSPLAMAVIGGPKGAPGQTARIKKPAETMGWAWNKSSKPTVTAGTIT